MEGCIILGGHLTNPTVISYWPASDELSGPKSCSSTSLTSETLLTATPTPVSLTLIRAERRS